ncbi:hypothetical protein FRB99_001892, partial [Tulasnella sp. 403]
YERFRLVLGFPEEEEEEEEEELPINDLLQSISNVVPSLLHLVASAEGIGINLTPRSCRYTSYLQTVARNIASLDVGIINAPPIPVLDWLIAGFGDAMNNVPTIRAEVVEYPSGKKELAVTAIGKFPLVTELQLSRDHTPVIRYLSSPTLVDGTLQWPLPRLTKLKFDAESYDPKVILDMVESRYGHTLEANSKAQLPSRFEFLTIINASTKLNWDQKVVDRIRNIVGEDHLQVTERGIWALL